MIIQSNNHEVKKILNECVPLILNDLVSTQKRPNREFVNYTDCLSKKNLSYIIENAFYLSQIYDKSVEEPSNKKKGGDSYFTKEYEICRTNSRLITPKKKKCNNNEIINEDLLQVHGLGGINSIPNEILHKEGNESIKIDESKEKTNELTCIDLIESEYNTYKTKYPSLDYPSCEDILLIQGKKYLDKESDYFLKRDYGRTDDNIVNIMVVIQENMPFIRKIVSIVKSYVDTKKKITTTTFNTFSSLFGIGSEDKKSSSTGFILPTFNPITRIIQTILKYIKLDIVEHSIQLITQLFPILVVNASFNDNSIDQIKEHLKKEVPNILNDLLKTKLKPNGEPIVYTDIFSPNDSDPKNNTLFFIIDHAYYLSQIYKLNKDYGKKYEEDIKIFLKKEAEKKEAEKKEAEKKILEKEAEKEEAEKKEAEKTKSPVVEETEVIKKPWKLRRTLGNLFGVKNTRLGKMFSSKKGGKHIKQKTRRKYRV